MILFSLLFNLILNDSIYKSSEKNKARHLEIRFIKKLYISGKNKGENNELDQDDHKRFIYLVPKCPIKKKLSE